MTLAKKVVVFDFDGTLVDSVQDVANSIAYAAQTVADLTPEQTPTFEQVLPHMGRHLADMFQELLPLEKHSLIDQCVQTYRLHYRANCTRTTVPFPGILELLTELKSRGVRLAIASNKTQPVITYVVNKLGMTNYFDHIQGIANFPGKPAPDMLFTVLQKLEVNLEEAVMVGDTDNDVFCAQKAGVTVCAVGWGGAWSALQLAELAPDYIAASVPELRTILHDLVTPARSSLEPLV